LAYTVSDPHNTSNYPIYVIDQDIGNCIVSIYDDMDECVEYFTEKNETKKVKETVYSTGT
jgi:hypothetical protein